MSRTAAPAESTHESFFGMLEQMTENARRGADSSKFGLANSFDDPLNFSATSDSRMNGSGLSNSSLPSSSLPSSSLPSSGFDRDLRFKANKEASIPTGISRTSRLRSPASNPVEPKAVKAKSASEAAELSYEKALQIHGRRRLQNQSDFDPPSRSSAAPETVTSRKQVPSAAAVPREKTAAREHSRDAAPTIARAILEAKIQIAAQRAADKLVFEADRGFIPEVSKATNPVSSPVSRAAKGQSASAKKKAPGRIAKNLSSPSADPLPSTQTSKPSSAKSQRQSNPAPIAAVVKRTSLQSSPRQSRLKAKVNLDQGVAAVSDRRELATLSHNLALEQRRSIVSIRLNDSELDTLRIRAAESGISVSAYMRSCVLDAEHLRTQVKQALAQMRACSGQQEPIQLAVSTGPGNGNTVWFRQVFRYVAFFFGPLFAIRRSV